MAALGNAVFPRGMTHGAEVEQSGEDALQFRTGGLVNEGKGGCGHQVVAGSLAAHLPIEPQGAEAGFAAPHTGQHQHDTLGRFPRLLLTSMEIEPRTWFADCPGEQT